MAFPSGEARVDPASPGEYVASVRGLLQLENQGGSVVSNRHVERRADTTGHDMAKLTATQTAGIALAHPTLSLICSAGGDRSTRGR